MHAEKIPFRNRHLQTYSNENTSATPVLFLHGNSSSSKTWEHQFNSRLNDHYYLIAFDFLGFGDSAHSENAAEDYSITALKNSVLAIINQLQLADYFIVGHSLGGHVIAQVIDQLKDCKGMVSIGAPPISLPPDIDAIYLKSAPTNVMFFNDCSDEVLQGVQENFFFTDTRVPDFFKPDFRKADGATREAIGAVLGSAEFHDEVQQLGSSLIPKAFVCGEHEKSIRNEYYESLDLPGVWKNKVHTIPDASHFPHWENPEAFNKLIEAFIRECQQNNLSTQS